MGQTGNDSVLHILFISGGTCLYSDEFSEHSDKMSFSNLFFFLNCEQICLPLWISWAEWSEGAKSQEDTEAVFKVQAPCCKSCVWGMSR